MTERSSLPTFENDSASRAAGTVAETVRRWIISDILRPGDAVTEEDLAARLGLSRTPIREGIARLEAEGLLLRGKNRQLAVFRPSLEDLVEIYDIRRALEPVAARLAADHATPKDVEELREIYDRMHQAKGATRIQQHEEFHWRLYEMAQRPRIAKFTHTLRLQSEPTLRLAIELAPEILNQADREHRRMITLLRKRDAEGLQGLMTRHLQRTIDTLNALLHT
jgi:DNA-binding GntR family transcriptional regulator